MAEKDKPRRIQIDIGGIREILESLAQAERRSLAAQIRVLIEEALEARGLWKVGFKPASAPDQSEIAELIERHWEKLVASAISPNCLSAYKAGQKPTEIDLLRIAIALGMSEIEIRELYDRSFPNNHDIYQRQTNGV